MNKLEMIEAIFEEAKAKGIKAKRLYGLIGISEAAGKAARKRGTLLDDAETLGRLVLVTRSKMILNYYLSLIGIDPTYRDNWEARGLVNHIFEQIDKEG